MCSIEEGGDKMANCASYLCVCSGALSVPSHSSSVSLISRGLRKNEYNTPNRRSRSMIEWAILRRGSGMAGCRVVEDGRMPNITLKLQRI
jgi:hypothetical protein